MPPDALDARLARRSRRYDAAAILVLLIGSALLLWTWADYGISWDERFHIEYGEHIFQWYASGFEDKTALSYRIDYLYGGGFDLGGAIFRRFSEPPLDQWDAVHLFGALIGLMGFWGCWRLGRALGGPRAGLLAALFICATSVYWGHAVNNPKDMPFAVGYVWAMAYLVEAIREFPRVPPKLAAKLAVAIGLAMSVRIAGMLLLCYLAAAILAWVAYHAWQRRDLEAGYRYARRLSLTGLAVAAGAWVVMLVWWPWAVYDPIKRPFAALRRMSQFMGHERKMPFAGELISTFDVDWRYMPHYFGLKLPEFIVIGLVLGTLVALVTLLVRLREVRAFSDNLVLGVLLLSLYFPWVYAVYKQSVLYDGLRHFLFEVPVVVASVAWLAELGIAKLSARVSPWAGLALGLALLGACVDQYATMVRLHPQQVVYFNRFIGGLAGAVGEYDTDYYAVTYGEAGKEFADALWAEDPELFMNTGYLLSGCGGELRMLRNMPPNFAFHKKRTDFWMGYTRDNCHRRHKKMPIYYELTREGGLLVRVRDLRSAKPVPTPKSRRVPKRPISRPGPNTRKPKPATQGAPTDEHSGKDVRDSP